MTEVPNDIPHHVLPHKLCPRKVRDFSRLSRCYVSIVGEDRNRACQSWRRCFRVFGSPDERNQFRADEGSVLEDQGLKHRKLCVRALVMPRFSVCKVERRRYDRSMSRCERSSVGLRMPSDASGHRHQPDRLLP